MSEEQVPGEQTNTDVVPDTPVPFIETLPDSLKTNDHLKGMESPEQLAQDFVNLKTVAPIIPESPDGYELVFDESVQIDQDVLTNFKGMAHGLKLTNEQTQNLANFYNKVQFDAAAKFIDNRNNELTTTESALKQEWGANFESEMAIVEKTKQQFMSPELRESLEATGFGNNVNLVKFMHKVGKAISEDSFIEGDHKSEKSVDETGRPVLSFPSMD